MKSAKNSQVQPTPAGWNCRARRLNRLMAAYERRLSTLRQVERAALQSEDLRTAALTSFEIDRTECRLNRVGRRQGGHLLALLPLWAPEGSPS